MNKTSFIIYFLWTPTISGLARGFLLNGEFYVRDNTARGFQWKLSVRDTVCRDQHLVYNRNANCCLLVPADFLQFACDKRLRGKFHVSTMTVAFKSVVLNLTHLLSYVSLFLPISSIVPWAEIWKMRAAVCIDRLLYSNDSLHGNRSLCSSLGIWERNRHW